MKRMCVSDAVIDYNLYPRGDVDNTHCRYMRISIEGGTRLPPPIVDKKSKRVSDGVHRILTYRRMDPAMVIDVIEKEYHSDVEMFEDAIRMNAHHGRNLSPYDRVHCIVRAEELGLSVEKVAMALSMTIDAVQELRIDRVSKQRLTVSGAPPEAIPIKRTISHMAGKTLTSRQVVANKKLGGMAQTFYVNQVIELIESDLVEKANDNLIARMQHLSEILKDYLRGI
jgi:hypothetical protein